MKKLIMLGVALLLVISLVGCGNGDTGFSSSWSVRGLSHDRQLGSWAIAARSIDGMAERMLDLSAEELSAIQVDISDNRGAITLVLIQGDITEVFELSRGFNGTLDTSNFEAGQILMRLNFVNAEDVDLSINWAI
ncbi:MAG: hypothetical protein FWC92_05185 [Defluviitaleaceae bacterium]|nr:hypothetical protein [Defluviitaleaceae bacterium]